MKISSKDWRMGLGIKQASKQMFYKFIIAQTVILVS